MKIFPGETNNFTRRSTDFKNIKIRN